MTARLPEATQRVLVLVNYALIAAFLVYVIYAGFWLSWISRARSFQGIPWVSYSLVTLAFPVGAALLLFTTALKALDTLRGAPEAGRPDAGAV